MNRFELELTGKKFLNDNTAHLNFRIISPEKYSFQAGQFLRLHFQQNDQEVFRSYSIATIFPQEHCVLEDISMAVSWVEGGLATGVLSSLEHGQSVPASGPFGRFCLPDTDFKRYFLIATGTGVTPYRAMLNELELRLQKGAEVYVVMGAQRQNGLLYEQDFLKMAGQYPGFNYVACLSREQREEPTNYDQSGYVQQYLQSIEFNEDSDITFLCGNPDMIDEAFALLKEKGLPVAQIRREKYISPKPRPVRA
ncbi:FAD-binding oxidoreductase [Marinicella sp. W31]|uniref:FAD-binding oxidoreductase n=1 Tax=Marinicella sp. W31 TaxID=3023713 RepID=UPI0037566D9E